MQYRISILYSNWLYTIAKAKVVSKSEAASPAKKSFFQDLF